MKKLVVSLVSATALATVGMAAAENSMAASTNNNHAGIFVSGDLGYGTISNSYYKSQYSNFNNSTQSDVNYFGGTYSQSSSNRNGDFAWAANLGYQFNQYLAIEAGYISFGQFKATDTVHATFTYLHAINGKGTWKNTFGGFDAAVKAILPISSQFDLFGKAGMVDMQQKATVSSTLQTYTGKDSIPSSSKTTSEWTPLLAVGTAYNIKKNVALNLQDDYAFESHGSNGMPSANVILAGASYKFNM